MAARDLFDLVGTTIAGKFRVERVLGEGGFGVVYAGVHVMLGERVAIKCLKPDGFTPEDSARAAQAFLREGRILFGLGHPAIVRLYDVGIIESGQIPYVVLELLTGTTLEAEIASRASARRHFGRDEIISLFTPILEAVAFAHERGVVHRDLKPANIMLVTEGGRVQPKVLDFGTARDDVVGTGRAGAPPEQSMGKTGFTPLYAAPEQWDTAYGRTGPHTDVYALGLTLAEVCLLGYPMDVSAGGILAVFRASLDESSRPILSNARPDLPSELERVVLRAMRSRGANRFENARELLNAFRAALKVAPPTAAMMAPIAPSNVQMHPSGPPQAPMAAPMAGASTTSPHAMHGYGPPRASAPAPPARSSVLPWVIASAVLVLALGVVGVVGLVAFVLPRSSSSASPAAPALTAPAVTVPIATAPAATVAPGSPPAPRAPAAPVATGPTPRLILGGAIGMAPFWTQSDVMDVARAHQNEMNECAREANAAQPGLNGSISITVSPNKSGVVGEVQCSLRVHDTAGEAAFCGCAGSAIGKWKYPPARGKLGFLDSGPFIYDYKLFPP